jgi:hypothetical protein
MAYNLGFQSIVKSRVQVIGGIAHMFDTVDSTMILKKFKSVYGINLFMGS